MAGCHHIVNRGVEQRDIFWNLQIMKSTLRSMEALKIGYSQQQVATVLGLSQSAVCLIVKKREQ